MMLKNNFDLNKESPYNHSKYNFVTQNSIDLKNDFIQFSEQNINRPKYQLELSELLNDIELAIKIELSIFEYTLIYCHNNKFTNNFILPIYNDKINEIICNIKNTNGVVNNTFRDNILNNIINPQYIAFMSPSQINPDKWQYIINKKKYKELCENNMEYTDIYKCYKCGESKTKITQAQTRGADEPMTTFVTCVVCFNTFKFG